MSLFSQEIIVDAKSASFMPKDTDSPAITIKGLAGQSEDLLIIKNSSDTELISVGTAGAFQGVSGQHLSLNTVSDSKNVRINSRNYTDTTGDAIGFQVKPAQTVSKTANALIGGEISPRLNNGVALAGASGVIMGLNVDPYLKGTAAGTVAGDVRALNLELVTDDAGTRAITGNVNHIRIRSAFSATSVGTFIPIRIEVAEAQTNSKSYDAVLDLTGTGTAWHDTDTVSGDTEAGFIRVRVNGNYRRILLFSDET